MCPWCARALAPAGVASHISLLSQILGSGGCAVSLSQLKPQHQKVRVQAELIPQTTKAGCVAEEKKERLQCSQRNLENTSARPVPHLILNTRTSRNWTKMMCFKFFSCRHIVLKVFLVQFLASLQSLAAPSPIIKFPGDDVSYTDKEVVLVSVFSFRWKNKAFG